MEKENSNFGYLIKVVKVAVFCGLGYWAAGPFGAIIGLFIATQKTKE